MRIGERADNVRHIGDRSQNIRGIGTRAVNFGSIYNSPMDRAQVVLDPALVKELNNAKVPK